MAALHANPDASRLLLSALYTCDPSAASPPLPRPERGAGGSAVGTALSLGAGDDSLLNAGLCIGLSNVTHLLGSTTSASSGRERAKRAAVSASRRIASPKKPKRAGTHIKSTDTECSDSNSKSSLCSTYCKFIIVQYVQSRNHILILVCTVYTRGI